jgi:sterol desaturase/sphingolipid hydroxylase (fatty acid hydroxylase superfamily)
MPLLAHAAQLYAYVYFGLIIGLSLLEWVVPRRQAGDALIVRWFGNFSISFLNTFLARLVFPLAGIAWATLCMERGWGLMNRLSRPSWLAFVVTVLVLDLGSYANHYLYHRVPLFWRFHRTHHTDLELDLSTGVRFHPFEMVATGVLSFTLIAALGALPIGVLVFELLSVAAAFFEHANLRMPAALDRVVRLVVVTADMHSVHHSRFARETNSNFGSIFTWWDRCFGTYADAPDAGSQAVKLGLDGFLARKHLALHWMLLTPWLRPAPEAEGQTPGVTHLEPPASHRVAPV